jgi:multiple antibiotic resistance protein
MKEIIINTLYLVALINPASKISILTMFTQKVEQKEISSIAIKSTAIALLILILSMVAGNIILDKIFHVDFYSLKIAGGFVLIWVGFSALRNGVFFEYNIQEKFADISLVPLACPMIAGPATITAVIALHINSGTMQTAIPIILAIIINYIFMKLSIPIGKILQKFNIMGALIRLTGLIVMTIGVQMILDGVSIWLENQ